MLVDIRQDGKFSLGQPETLLPVLNRACLRVESQMRPVDPHASQPGVRDVDEEHSVCAPYRRPHEIDGFSVREQELHKGQWRAPLAQRTKLGKRDRTQRGRASRAALRATHGSEYEARSREREQ